MRRIHYADVSCAARALMPVAEDARWDACRQMIARAEVADAYRCATGRLHPKWGSGSLMEVARLVPLPPEPGFDNLAFRAAFQVLLTCLDEKTVTPTRS